MKTQHVIPSLALTLLAASCGGDATHDGPMDATVDPGAPHPLEPFYLSEVPGESVEVAALRELKSGARVQVRGDVQDYAPVGGRAVLSLFDHTLLSCDEIEGDQCPTPWDFCCTPDDVKAKNSATVEFRDEGALVKAELGGFHGIDYLSDVIVTGTLELDDSGNARIIADGLHVE